MRKNDMISVHETSKSTEFCFFANSWNFTEFSELTMFKNFAMSRDIRLITKNTYVIFHLAVEDDNFSSIFLLPY